MLKALHGYPSPSDRISLVLLSRDEMKCIMAYEKNTRLYDVFKHDNSDRLGSTSTHFQIRPRNIRVSLLFCRNKFKYHKNEFRFEHFDFYLYAENNVMHETSELVHVRTFFEHGNNSTKYTA